MRAACGTQVGTAVWDVAKGWGGSGVGIITSQWVGMVSLCPVKSLSTHSGLRWVFVAGEGAHSKDETGQVHLHIVFGTKNSNTSFRPLE